MTWAVVRVRGGVHAEASLNETMRHLHLTRQNHLVILPEKNELRGMVNKVQGYVTWGPVSAPTVEALVKARALTEDGHLLDAAKLPPVSGAKDLKGLAERVHKEGSLHIPGVKPLFRLHPPKGGWRSTKKPYTLGGALGYREPGTKIDMDKLIARMI
ncbi:MAG: 50S ribosomal protein L30 [Euryarchaeota archaeon]|nr:50S ribosomal protein L30 [Euryarchaeota archaeon]MDE1835719.1 50S ribosomal protein L30 [Euryarchaeota archaeon]MDE1880856.1 50S ribosomal protein L30 [Euryarchaeota archaeon]MDE2043910.1 50S ribosomal protein L30 [Thermoplasmata archaeon]